MTALDLLLIVSVFVGLLAGLAWLSDLRWGPDPDLAAGGYDPRTTCGRPGCISHPRERR